MTRAWEIAREGVKKFGGKVKEYFAQALVMAWAEIKKGVEKMEIGYKKLKTVDGVFYFLTNDHEDLKVSWLTEEFNGYTGKHYTKHRDMTDRFQLGTDNNTGKTMRLYNIAKWAGDIEIKLGDQKLVVENHRPEKWA